MALLAFLLLAWAPCQGCLAAVSGFPGFDPKREIVIFDSRNPSAQKQAQTKNRRGEWRANERGLVLSRPHPFGENYWLPESQAARFGDGIVRARLRSGDESLRCSLLLRTEVNSANPEEFSGYGLSLHGRRIGFVRWTRGLRRSLGVGDRIPKSTRDSVLEVTVQLSGTRLTARVYAGSSLVPLGNVHDR